MNFGACLDRLVLPVRGTFQFRREAPGMGDFLMKIVCNNSSRIEADPGQLRTPPARHFSVPAAKHLVMSVSLEHFMVTYATTRLRQATPVIARR